MRLQGANGDRLALEIVRYEFPATARDSLEWLVIRFSAEVGGREWAGEDACLETPEVDRLATWLELAAEGFAKHTIAFTEPTLEFEASPKADGLIRLRVWVEWGFRPPWAPSEFPDHDFAVELLLPPAELMAAAADLREQRRRFPDRVSTR